MKRNIFLLILGFGWVLLAIFLVSGYYFNKLSFNSEDSFLQPIPWKGHTQIFEGLVQCKLVGDDLLERKKELKEKVFSKVSRKEEVHNGYIYYFEEDQLSLNDALEFIKYEAECCPFFKFDISIMPFDYGYAFQISGSEEAFAMLHNFEHNEF